MTRTSAITYGVDLSHYQAGLNTYNLFNQGYEFIIAKCTEGIGYADASYTDFWQGAQDRGFLFMAYHFLNGYDDVTAQAENLANHIGDKAIPVAIDLESSRASQPTLTQAAGFKQAAAHLGIRADLLYFPGWYWQQQGSPSLRGWRLWQSNYGDNPRGHGATLYPGNNSHRWDTQGGTVPTLLQYGSQGIIDGYAGGVDVNAYRGTREALSATGLFRDYSKAHHTRHYPGVEAALRSNAKHVQDLNAIRTRRAGVARKLALAALAHERKSLEQIVGK